MKNFFINLLSSNGKISSKRLVTLLAFVMMSIAFIANLFWDHSIDPALISSMEYVVIAGLGFTASERFAKKEKTTTEENPVI